MTVFAVTLTILEAYEVAWAKEVGLIASFVEHGHGRERNVVEVLAVVPHPDHVAATRYGIHRAAESATL